MKSSVAVCSIKTLHIFEHLVQTMRRIECGVCIKAIRTSESILGNAGGGERPGDLSRRRLHDLHHLNKFVIGIPSVSFRLLQANLPLLVFSPLSITLSKLCSVSLT